MKTRKMDTVRRSLKAVGQALDALLAESRQSFLDERRHERWYIEPK